MLTLTFFFFFGWVTLWIYYIREWMRNLNEFREIVDILGIKLSREVLDSLVKILHQWILSPSNWKLCSIYIFSVFPRLLHIRTFSKHTHTYIYIYIYIYIYRYTKRVLGLYLNRKWHFAWTFDADSASGFLYLVLTFSSSWRRVHNSVWTTVDLFPFGYLWSGLGFF